MPTAFAVLLIGFGSGSVPANAQETASRDLVVGTREAPPFAIKNPDGTWSGLSIDLWNRVAEELNITTTWREMGAPESLITGVTDGSIDASIAAITVTAERAKAVDFSQPFYNSGLGIVVPAAGDSGWWATLRAFFSVGFLKVVVALSLVLLAAGFGVWFFERKTNPEQFGGSTAKGLGNGFWWSAVTMTTVGYGDKAPQTVGGRVIALVWMFTSIIIISGFTAQIASSLTVNRIQTEIKSANDLKRVTVATVQDSAAATWLHDARVKTIESADIQSALNAVASGEAAAVVYDEPILRYFLRERPELTILPATFERRDYAIALPLGSPLRKEANIALLEFIQAGPWAQLETRYLGIKD